MTITIGQLVDRAICSSTLSYASMALH